jgi:hypothetical protein
MDRYLPASLCPHFNCNITSFAEINGFVRANSKTLLVLSSFFCLRSAKANCNICLQLAIFRIKRAPDESGTGKTGWAAIGAGAKGGGTTSGGFAAGGTRAGSGGAVEMGEGLIGAPTPGSFPLTGTVSCGGADSLAGAEPSVSGGFGAVTGAEVCEVSIEGTFALNGSPAVLVPSVLVSSVGIFVSLNF